MPEENPTIGPRTRFFDDSVVNAIRDGLRQITLVAAGMDTRAFRLPLPPDATIFELDQAEVLAEKQLVLDGLNARARCRRVVLPVDLQDERWKALLTDSGFDPSRPAVFVAEGLSAYLTEDQNTRLLDDLASLATPGRSRLAMDMLSRDYLENPAVQRFLELLADRGVPWRFGTNEPGPFLAGHGWRADVSNFDVVGRRFGRWPPPGVAEDVASRAAAASRNYFIRAERVLQ
jgi:methyltransferase (TIGR00027 family)